MQNVWPNFDPWVPGPGGKILHSFLPKLLANLFIFQTYFMHYPQQRTFLQVPISF